MTQCSINRAKNVLVTLGQAPERALDELTKVFCGTVTDTVPLTCDGLTLYLCGDITQLSHPLPHADRIFVIKELSTFGPDLRAHLPVTLISLNRVPVLINNVGVYYHEFFDPNVDHFSLIKSEHNFQDLTESNKTGQALRKGIYLTKVIERPESDALDFHLLRCSTNLSGPTDNFRATDIAIVDALNKEAQYIFKSPAELNHVLAQVYENTRASDSLKAKKAKIAAHSDKTKDMPIDGIMAFCTFYDKSDIKEDALTKLHFRLKKNSR